MRVPAVPASVRPSWWSVGHVGGSALVALATFLPWIESGERGLSIYDLRDTAHRLELLDDPWIVAPIAFVPLLLALGLLARWANRPGTAHAVALAAGAYTALGALAVRSSGIPTGTGPSVALVGAAILLLAAGGELLWARRAGARASHSTDVGVVHARSQHTRWANDGATDR